MHRDALYLRRKVASPARRYSGPSISEVWANPGGVEVPDAFASSAAVGCVFAPTAEFLAGVSSPSAATSPAYCQNFVAAVSGVLDPASAEVSDVLFAVERIAFPDIGRNRNREALLAESPPIRTSMIWACYSFSHRVP